MDLASKELEVDQFIRSQMQLKLALKLLFTKVERVLLRNNKIIVLNSSSSDADDTSSIAETN